MKKVICVDNKDGEFGLTIGKEYTVLNENEGYYTIECDRGSISPFLKSRFESVPRQVVCVDFYGKSTGLTVGKVYEVIEEDENSYLIMDDRRVPGRFSPDIFKDLNECIRLLCIRSEPYEAISEGREYIATREGFQSYEVIDDVGILRMFYKDRFEKVGERVVKKRVECITDGSPLLTKGKMYEVYREDVDHYHIIDDEGTWNCFVKHLFTDRETKKVTCTDNDNGRLPITVGKVYEVIEERGYSYYINDNDGKDYYYSKDLFTEKELKKVVCKDNADGAMSLTIGKEYEVIDESLNSYLLINDMGDRQMYDKNRFKQEGQGGEQVEKKVVCIDDGGLSLTVGKTYKVTEEEGDYYFVKNDRGIEQPYKKKRFMDVGEKPLYLIRVHYPKNSRYEKLRLDGVVEYNMKDRHLHATLGSGSKRILAPGWIMIEIEEY